MDGRERYAPQCLHKVVEMQMQVDRPSVPCRPTGAPHSKSWVRLKRRNRTRQTGGEWTGGAWGRRVGRASHWRDIRPRGAHEANSRGPMPLNPGAKHFPYRGLVVGKVALSQSQSRVAKEFLSSMCVVCPICHALLELLRIFCHSARLAGVTILPMSLLAGLYFCDTGSGLQITVSCDVRKADSERLHC